MRQGTGRRRGNPAADHAKEEKRVEQFSLFTDYKKLDEQNQKEKEREKLLIENDEMKAKIDEIKDQIRELERQAEPYESISLLNVKVSMRGLGDGIVISQDRNKVTVQFANETKSYSISRKYFVRPTFEDNEEILDAFTDYERILSEIKTLEKRIEMINNGV